MRILHVGKYFPPARGGMETVLGEISRGLLQRGHELGVLAAASGVLSRREVLAGQGGGAGRLERLSCFGSWRSQPLIPGLAGALRRQLRHFDPDVVHLHLPNPGACAAWLMQGPLGGLRDRRPALAIWHHADITRQKIARSLVRPVVEACFDRADGICVSSEALRLHSPTLATRRDRCVVIPFGIDLEPWLELEPSGDGDFLFVGRLVAYKGVDVLLEAVRRLPRARLSIVGEGPRGDVLRDLSRRNGLDGRVSFLGAVSEGELRRRMASARALVLPSDQAGETFGLVQIEAMAAGVPVIATALPTGVAEVGVDGQTGRCVAPADPEALAGALSEILDDPEQARQWGEAGRLRAKDHFEGRRMHEELERWYESLVDGRS